MLFGADDWRTAAAESPWTGRSATDGSDRLPTAGCWSGAPGPRTRCRIAGAAMCANPVGQRCRIVAGSPPVHTPPLLTPTRGPSVVSVFLETAYAAPRATPRLARPAFFSEDGSPSTRPANEGDTAELPGFCEYRAAGPRRDVQWTAGAMTGSGGASDRTIRFRIAAWTRSSHSAATCAVQLSGESYGGPPAKR